MATKRKGGNKMDEKQKGSGIVIMACITIAATLAGGGLGVYLLTGEELRAPTLLSPSDNSETTDNTPTFVWENAPHAENYRLLVDNDPDFSSPEVDITLGAGEDSYTVPDENALPYDSYYWKVIAIRGSVEKESETWTCLLPELSAPTLVSPLDGSEMTDDTLTFEWKNVLNAESYRLLVDNDSDFSSPEVDVTLGVGEDSYTVPDENALSYGSYYWKVIAIRQADEGNASDDGVSRSVERESETWKNNVKEAVAPYP